MKENRVRIVRVDLDLLKGSEIQEGIELKRISDGEKDTKGLNISIVSFEPDTMRPWNSHAQDQYVLCLRGRGVIVLEEDEIEVEKGMMAQIPAGLSHRHGAPVGNGFIQLSIIGGEKNLNA